MEKPNFIIITGPESTGKTELSKTLANELKCSWVPELSRQYIENLGRPYTKYDVETIARLQVEQFNNRNLDPDMLTIFDTGLIITKVWFEVVYRDCPMWFTQEIMNLPKALHLVCATDIPWIPDGVRENGGEMREILFDIYIQQLELFKFPYFTIKGIGEKRTENALSFINQFFR